MSVQELPSQGTLNRHASRLSQEASGPRRQPARHAAVEWSSSLPRRSRFFTSSKKRHARPGGWAKYKQSAATEYKRAEERMRFGSQGAASPVRKIDPVTGEVIAIIPGKTL